jgi:hypothetical protein
MPDFITYVPEVVADENTIENNTILGLKVKGKKVYSGSGWDMTGLQSKRHYSGFIACDDCSSANDLFQVSVNGGSVETAIDNLIYGSTSLTKNVVDGIYYCVNSTPNILYFDLKFINGYLFIHTWNYGYSGDLTESFKIVTGLASFTQITFSVSGASFTNDVYYLEEWD